MTHSRPGRSIALLGILALVIAACGGGGGASPSAAVSADTGAASPSAAESMAETSPSAAESMAETSPTSEAPASARPPASGVDLAGANITVGSKEFTEQLILGQITIQVLEDAGATVNDQTGLQGSTVVREALNSGEIDMYWEYSGTGWINHLGNDTPIIDAQEQYEAVKEADAANDIAWLDPAPFNNTYAIALASENATELGLASLSDVTAFATDNPEKMTLCAAAEFLGRDDGLPGLEEAYGFKFSDVSEVEFGLIFPSIDKSDPCIFGEVFATDGRLAALDLTVLEDDKVFFGTYLPALNVRQEVLDANPGVADLFGPVADALDSETMKALNAKVDVDGEEPAAAAKTFLEEKGLVGG